MNDSAVLDPASTEDVDDTRARRWLAAVLVALLLVVVVLSFQGPQDQLRSWGLLPRPAVLTELAFEPGQQLPPPRTTPDSLSIRFQITNDSPKQRAYPWVATLVREGASTLPLVDGTATVEANGTTVIPLDVKVPNCGLRQVVNIRLPDVSEQITVRFDDRQTPVRDRSRACAT